MYHKEYVFKRQQIGVDKKRLKPFLLLIIIIIIIITITIIFQF